jgi:hypothetical protein
MDFTLRQKLEVENKDEILYNQITGMYKSPVKPIAGMYKSPVKQVKQISEVYKSAVKEEDLKKYTSDH